MDIIERNGDIIAPVRQHFCANGIVIEVWTDMGFLGEYMTLARVRWIFGVSIKCAIFSPAVVAFMKPNVLVVGDCSDGFVITVLGVECKVILLVKLE